jgi:hypothetical protein
MDTPRILRVVKTGMQCEHDLAQKYFNDPHTLHISGIQSVQSLSKLIPASAESIISFGLCGGLGPVEDGPVVGQAFIYNRCVTPDGVLKADPFWCHRLFLKLKYFERGCWSSGIFNTADTLEQRAALYTQSGCWVIDDETYTVAQFANTRGMTWAGLRVVSDGPTDTVPPFARNALKVDGSVNIPAFIESMLTDPGQLALLPRLVSEYNLSMAELERAAIDVGPIFQAPV